MGTIDTRVAIPGIRGLDYEVAVGINDEGRRVLVIRMRENGTERYHPVIEMDIDVPSFYRDIDSGFDFGREEPPIPK